MKIVMIWGFAGVFLEIPYKRSRHNPCCSSRLFNVEVFFPVVFQELLGLFDLMLAFIYSAGKENPAYVLQLFFFENGENQDMSVQSNLPIACSLFMNPRSNDIQRKFCVG